MGSSNSLQQQLTFPFTANIFLLLIWLLWRSNVCFFFFDFQNGWMVLALVILFLFFCWTKFQVYAKCQTIAQNINTFCLERWIFFGFAVFFFFRFQDALFFSCSAMSWALEFYWNCVFFGFEFSCKYFFFSQ